MRAPLLLIAGGALVAAALAAVPQRPSTLPDYDVLLVGGTVVDGTGAPRRTADVAVTGDRITAIGELRGRTARRIIDASGLVVAPGFIDILGQSEATNLVDPRA